jgi:serine/threonine-protein kinase
MAMRATLTATQEIGGYRLAELLGEGGMGAVYRAVHRATGRQVAIKVFEGGEGARFENEARIQASLAHPHIAAMHEYFEDRGLRCLVMELVPGETLAQRIGRGPLAPADALSLLADAAGAAGHMHRRGIVHRDLTASNIRITPDGRVKVLDFGIAKIEHLKGVTEAGHVIGTPAYLSPEQLRTGRATPRSDVWSLGVLLFEMVTGRLPFHGSSPSDVSRAIHTARAGEYASALPAGHPARARVASIVERCLAIDPEQRFPNGNALRDALTANPSHLTHHHPTHVLTYPRTHCAAAAAILVAAALFLFAFFSGGAAPATTVHRIDVSEGVADVVINGSRRGRTPFDYEAARDETVSLELRQPGFLPVRERFVVTERPFWTFSMRRER